MGITAYGSLFYGVKLTEEQVLDIEERSSFTLICTNCSSNNTTGKYCSSCGTLLKFSENKLPEDFLAESKYEETNKTGCHIENCGYDSEPHNYYVVVTSSLLEADDSWDELSLSSSENWRFRLDNFFSFLGFDSKPSKWYFVAWIG